MRILAVFYACSNQTKAVAESIAAKCGADVLEIKNARCQKGVLGNFMSGGGAMIKRLAKIQPVDKNARDYDLVILGTPVWSYSLSSPMRTYIAEYGSEFNRVAFFCTEGGSSGERAFKHMSEIIGQKPVATMEITDADLKNGSDKIKLALFTDTIAPSTARSTDILTLHELELVTS